VAPLVMDCANKANHDWTKCWTYMALLMHSMLEIWITEDLQEGMCLNCSEKCPRGVGQSVTECVVKPLRVEKSPV
jgi:hypothetical protein